MSMPQESWLLELESTYEAVVKAPASCFLIGEHAVLHDKSAIVIPIPLYLYLGMSLTQDKGLTLSNRSISRDPESDCRQDLTYKSEHQDDMLLQRIYSIIFEHFRDKWHKHIGGITIGTRSDIPVKCGLGSSGAFSAAMSMAAHFLILPEAKQDIREFQKESTSRLISDNVFNSVFQLAWSLEEGYSRKSSGCAPFASLVGSTDQLPLIYSAINIESRQVYARRMSEILSPQDVLQVRDMLWRSSGFALVFSGQERSRSTDQLVSKTDARTGKFLSDIRSLSNRLNLGEHISGLPSDLSYLQNVALAERDVDRSFWDVFGLIFISSLRSLIWAHSGDLERSINSAQSLFALLEVDIPSLEDFATKCRNCDVACKITGWGQGGDVLLFGERHQIMNCTADNIQLGEQTSNRLRLHYASWLDTHTPHTVSGAEIISSHVVSEGHVHQAVPEKADFVIITAIEEEDNAVATIDEWMIRKSFNVSQNSLTRNQHLYFWDWVPSVSNPQKQHFVVWTKCLTKGNQGSQHLTEQVLFDWGPSYILLVGTAGAIAADPVKSSKEQQLTTGDTSKRQGVVVTGRQGISLCDVVVSNDVVYDSRKEVFDRIELYECYLKRPASHILELVEDIRRKGVNWWETLGDKPLPLGGQPRSIVGQIISGSNLRGNPNSQDLLELIGKLPRAIAVEMEAAGVGYALWRKEGCINTQYAVVKGLTDWVNVNPEDNQKTRNELKNYAAQAAAALAFAIVEQES